MGAGWDSISLMYRFRESLWLIQEKVLNNIRIEVLVEGK